MMLGVKCNVLILMLVNFIVILFEFILMIFFLCVGEILVDVKLFLLMKDVFWEVFSGKVFSELFYVIGYGLFGWFVVGFFLCLVMYFVFFLVIKWL